MKGFKRILWLFIAMALVVALGFGCAPTRKAAPPAKAEEMYFPEVFGRGDGGLFRVSQ